MMSEGSSIPKYATKAISAQERVRRGYIDSLIKKVHAYHGQYSPH